jgi:hypothetical protein
MEVCMYLLFQNLTQSCQMGVETSSDARNSYPQARKPSGAQEHAAQVGALDWEGSGSGRRMAPDQPESRRTACLRGNHLALCAKEKRGRVGGWGGRQGLDGGQPRDTVERVCASNVVAVLYNHTVPTHALLRTRQHPCIAGSRSSRPRRRHVRSSADL